MEVLPAAHLFRDPVLRPAELGQNGGRQQTMKIQEPHEQASRNGAGPLPVGNEPKRKDTSMKLRTLLASTALGVVTISFGMPAPAADIKEVQMLHWWTSGGEAAALDVIKQAVAKKGFAWKDVPVAGGGGGAAMTTLKANVAAGNPPTASQILGYYALEYAEQGALADISSLAGNEGWTSSFRRRCRGSPRLTASGAPFRSTFTPSTGSG